MEAVQKLVTIAEDAGILRDGNANYSSRLIARSAIPILEVYGKDDNYRELFLKSMQGLLLKQDAGCPN